MEKNMSLSRRQFLTSSTMSAVSVPLLLSMDIDYCEAASPSSIDWSMGFPKDAVLLNRNENPIGPSPLAIEAAQNGIPRSFRYADAAVIRSLLAEHHGMENESILVGTGSGELLKLAPLVFARDGNVVATLESYRQTPAFAEKLGSQVKWVNLLKDKNYAYDIKGLLAAVDADTRLLFAVTPNNPTGTTLSYHNLKTIADALPKHVLFVIDEAYVHFQGEGKTGIDLVKEGYSNVLVTRTFSKAYALAGLRCGYGVGHPDIMKKISKFGCGPTSTNMAGFGAAIASLSDHAHLQKSRKFVSDSRAYYEKNFRALGIDYVSGPPIFILAEFGKRTTAIRDALREKKVFVRDGVEWDMPNHIRISYGFEEENKTFFKEIKRLL
jgi:histidinol-phosphate aminotransferase